VKMSDRTHHFAAKVIETQSNPEWASEGHTHNLCDTGMTLFHPVQCT